MERSVMMDSVVALLILLIPHRFFPLHPVLGRVKLYGKNPLIGLWSLVGLGLIQLLELLWGSSAAWFP